MHRPIAACCRRGVQVEEERAAAERELQQSRQRVESEVARSLSDKTAPLQADVARLETEAAMLRHRLEQQVPARGCRRP